MLILLIGAGGLAAVAVDRNVGGAGEQFETLVARVERVFAGPPPNRPIQATVRVTPRPVVRPSPTATPAPVSLAPGVTAAPTPRATASPVPTPEPARTELDFDIAANPEAVFKTELHKDWCAPAGVQMVLAQLGLVDTSDRAQKEIAARVREWESREDSRNGDWGPAAMALALEAYGAPGYEIRGFESRDDALRDAAAAIEAMDSPVILLAWRGAHTWVMTGFRADADPAIFEDARIKGTYILDPWYPRMSSIWGPSDPAGTYQDGAEMRRNFLPWKRPEGGYPDRDGLFITIVPTLPAPTAG
ncbi:MAG: hypothetical protein H0U58_06410 [Chloroflexi bacterium]|nr:hypothetical protein [Chloroflexota bacterium]